MPFTRYLQDRPFDDEHQHQHQHHHQPHNQYSHPVQFQLPQFIYDGPPVLAPGGGAEVVPHGSSWFANTGFGVPRATPTPTPPPPPPRAADEIEPAGWIPAPPPPGLPIYSSSGFDLLSILARVHARPNPQVVLGPVDLSCSFVITDVRRHDSPIVYCSPSFCLLTGYAEHEILGRNCRFLQAPSGAPLGSVPPQPAAALLRKALRADKECQASLMNYRKDGSAFLNLLTVIPITGGVDGHGPDDDVVFHVGFQVDLTEQPNVILNKLRDGSYKADYARTLPPVPPLPLKKSLGASAAALIPAPRMSPALAALLADSRFVASLPLDTATNVPPPLPALSAAASSSSTPAPHPALSHPLALLLLNHAPDFTLVVSLKGAFLYVAPAVRRVLGYRPRDLVGKALADLAHPHDLVPLERELKDGAVGPLKGDPLHVPPRPIDLLFRARTLAGRHVWLECRGRLHAEPGKARKAIVLSARAHEMARLNRTPALPAPHHHPAAGFCALVAPAPRPVWLALAPDVTRVLGWAPAALVGTGVPDLLARPAEDSPAVARAFFAARHARAAQGAGQSVVCAVRTPAGDAVRVEVSVWRAAPDGDAAPADGAVAPAPLVVFVRPVAAACGVGAGAGRGAGAGEVLFEELGVARGSSWQYELQQLKYANERMKSEIAVLEGREKARARGGVSLEEEGEEGEEGEGEDEVEYAAYLEEGYALRGGEFGSPEGYVQPGLGYLAYGEEQPAYRPSLEYQDEYRQQQQQQQEQEQERLAQGQQQEQLARAQQIYMPAPRPPHVLEQRWLAQTLMRDAFDAGRGEVPAPVHVPMQMGARERWGAPAVDGGGTGFRAGSKRPWGAG